MAAGPADGPLVLLLHGFPQSWWTWRHQIAPLAEAGLRTVAVDLRGYGGSDKPPRGYDPYTLSADVAGLVRALGARDAHLVGQDWGGYLAWVTATLHPRLVNRLTVLGAAHPVALRDALRSPGPQVKAFTPVLGFQVPKRPERQLAEGTLVDELLRRWSVVPPTPEAAARCTEAMAVPAAAHCALEYFRWSVRSLTRPSGRRFYRVMAAGVQAPVLQLHGADDPYVLAATARGSAPFAHGPYALELLEGVGHFPAEEAPDRVTAAVLEHACAER